MVEKSLLEISRFNVKRFWWCNKNAFWGAKNAFFATAPIHIVWYIRKLFDCLGVSKCVSI
jgi:hypothetical protein